MDEELDFGGAIQQDFRTQEINRLEQELIIEQPDSMVSEAPEEEPAPFNAGAVFSDVARGLTEAPMQLVGGARDATQNTLTALDNFNMWVQTTPLGTDWMREAMGQPTVSEMREDAGFEGFTLPDVPEAESVTGGFLRSTSQFLTGFIPAIKGVQAVSAGGRTITGMGRFAQAEAAAALTSALVFDPHEARLSNLLEEAGSITVPWTDTEIPLSNAITEYLAADPEDSELEGRFKNVLEGLGLGVVAEGLMRGLGALRANRFEKGLEPGQPVGNEAPLMTQLGDASEGAELVVPAPGRSKLPFQMNWARYSSSEDIESAVRKVADMYTETIDEARRGSMSTEDLQTLAKQLNLTPDDIINGRFRGGAYRAEEIIAMRAVLEDATTTLTDLARLASTSGNPSDLFAFRKMLDIHVGIQSQFQGAASEAGRSLRALQIPAGSAENQIRMIESSLMQGQSPDQVRKLAYAVSQVTDPAQIAQAARGGVGKRINDAIIEWWYFALLSGPRTHAVNISSGILNSMFQVPERLLASGFSALRGTNNIKAGESLQMLYGFVSSLPDAFRAAGRAFVTDTPGDLFNKTEARVQRAISSENFPVGRTIENLLGTFAPPGVGRALGAAFTKGIDGLGTIVRMPTRALMAEDEFFRIIGKSMDMRAQAFRTGTQEGLEGPALAERMADILNNPTSSMFEQAEAFSRSITFTEELGPTGRQFQSLINQHPALKMVIPFIRTPVNLLKWVGRRTPLGLFSQNIRRDIQAGGAAGDLALSRMTMGSMLGLVTADMAMRGSVTGAGPTDPYLRQVWMRDNQPYSVKIGDTWYSYNRMDPFGLLLGASASYAELAGQLGPQDREELAAAIALATSQSVFSKTWLQGPAAALDAIMQPDRYGAQFVEQTAGTFLMPTGASQVAGVMDPMWREVDGLVDQIRSRTPGFSQDLPPRRNLWGQPIMYQGGLGPDIISPIAKFGEEDRPIDEWMLENRVTPAMPSQFQGGVELTPEQYSRFVELSGNEIKDPMTGLGAYDSLNALVEGTHPNSFQWQNATDGPEGGRALIVNNIISSFRQMAQAQLMQEFPDYRARVNQRAMEESEALRTTIMNPSGGRL